MAARSELEIAQREISELKRRITTIIAANEAALRAIQESRSWKITAPLRTLMRALKRIYTPKAVAPEAPSQAVLDATAAIQTNDAQSYRSHTDSLVVADQAPRTAVSVAQDLHGLDEFTAFAEANPVYFDDQTEQLILTHCQSFGIHSTAMGFCPPSEVSVIGPEAREHLRTGDFSSRHRAILEELYAFLQSRRLSPDEVKIYGHEAITPLALFLRGRFPKYIGTEFATTEIQKDELFPIRHGDVCQSDFPSSSFDVIVSCDVLEHVPNMDDALRESARILRKGGCLLATFPFLYCRQGSVKFATVINGEVRHLISEPIYHGNPMDPARGSLVYEIFGWDVLDRARTAGFTHTAMRFICDQNKGIVATSLGEPLRAKGVFVAIFSK